jgi:hypothetical protein
MAELANGGAVVEPVTPGTSEINPGRATRWDFCAAGGSKDQDLFV